MEYWNLFDYKGKKKDKIAIMGSKLNNDDFHLVVNYGGNHEEKSSLSISWRTKRRYR